MSRELEELTGGLVARAPEAWERLYNLTHIPLLRMLRRLTGDESAAEEALQATYLTAIERIGAFNPRKGAADAWLAGIARRKALEVRRNGRPGPQAIDPPSDPQKTWESNGRAAAVLDRLEPRYAEVLRRKYVEEQSLGRIARELGLKQATVGTLLHRGRARFRELYERMLEREAVP